jgi:hypothetical protein
VVRKVVTGSAPPDWRALYVVEASVERKAGVPMPESQLLPEDTTEDPLLTWPLPLLTARFLPRRAAPVAK